jgi:hypothetical protein
MELPVTKVDFPLSDDVVNYQKAFHDPNLTPTIQAPSSRGILVGIIDAFFAPESDAILLRR